MILKYLTSKFKAECKKEFLNLGFKMSGMYFYRVVNDMFQSFHLHRSVDGCRCTVEFCTVPLCIGEDINKAFCGSNHLKMFWNDWSWFDYDRKSSESMDNCVDAMTSCMKEYLIPYFEQSDNSLKAYGTICDFQSQHYRDGILWLDNNLLHLSLKNCMFDMSLKHLNAQKRHIEVAAKRNRECFGEEWWGEEQEKYNTKIQNVEFMIKIVSEPNIEYIGELIERNEKIALANLGMR